MSEELYLRVAGRLVAHDGRLEPAVADGMLWMIEPASGWPVMIGVAGDGRGSVKLYAAARVDRSMSRSLGSSLGRLLGMVQVLPVDDESEVRRWSPYRLEDIERTPAEADDWAAATLQTLLEELRPRGIVTPPDAPTRDVAAALPSEVPGVAGPEGAADPAAGRAVAVVPAGTQRDPAPGIGLESADRRAEDAVELAAEAARDLARTEEQRAQATADLARVTSLLDDVTLDRDRVMARLRDLEARPSGLGDGVDPTSQLLASFELIVDSGARVGTCIAVLRQFLLIAPKDRHLRESLGIYLLRDDQVADAIATLSGLGSVGLTPRGASALVEAGFRQRKLPEPLDILARVDWRVASVAQQLREVPRWAKKENLLSIAELVSQSAPPEFEAFLKEVARTIGREQLQSLFGLWFDLDPTAALDQLVDWVAADRTQLGQQWAQDAVRLALGSEDRRTARAALDLLSEDAERRKDAGDLVSLVESARGLVRPADWRPFAVRWLRDAASITTDERVVDRCAELALDILRELPSVREDDPERQLAMILERRASDAFATILRDELARLRPADVAIRDVTTVSEALDAAVERYPSLVVLADAERSAAKRGTAGVKKAREALFMLGEISERYAAGELEQGLDLALAALPDFKPDISDTAKRQYQRHYVKTLGNGKKVRLGPHFDIGGEDGRAYLYVDKDQKRIVLGHCGEHLPGKRDS